jgi:antitoxin (DNA-binding transcriptional repressor) of toxin-antitoxin stability system
MDKKTREIPAGVFKNTCLKLIDEVHDSREEVIITKRGIPMVRMVPIIPVEEKRLYFGCMKGTVTYNCDPKELASITAADLGVEWEVDKEELGVEWGVKKDEK